MSNAMLPVGWWDVDEEYGRYVDKPEPCTIVGRVSKEILQSLAVAGCKSFRQDWWIVAGDEAVRLATEEQVPVSEAACKGIWKADEWAEN